MTLSLIDMQKLSSVAAPRSPVGDGTARLSGGFSPLTKPGAMRALTLRPD